LQSKHVIMLWVKRMTTFARLDGTGGRCRTIRWGRYACISYRCDWLGGFYDRVLYVRSLSYSGLCLCFMQSRFSVVAFRRPWKCSTLWSSFTSVCCDPHQVDTVSLTPWAQYPFQVTLPHQNSSVTLKNCEPQMLLKVGLQLESRGDIRTGQERRFFWSER